MKAYLDILKDICATGTFKENRTGITTILKSGMMFRHEMKEGFPLLTTKKMPFHLIASELEFFIKGITDKRWLQERNNHIWDEWCSPVKVPYSNSDTEIQKRMREEVDLGPIYGWQWRHFGAKYIDHETDYTNCGIDQFAEMIKKVKNNPDDRRIIVSAWNPLDIHKMALPPCHHTFQVLVNNDKIDLIWSQRSVDSILGLPFNIASYALLLHLICLETGYKPGVLVGFLHDTHIYKNHLRNFLEIQCDRIPRELPVIHTDNFTSIFDWNYTNSKVIGYDPHGHIQYDIAI